MTRLPEKRGITQAEEDKPLILRSRIEIDPAQNSFSLVDFCCEQASHHGVPSGSTSFGDYAISIACGKCN